MTALILKPLVIAAVDVQHHPRQWTALTPLAMHATPGLPLHQASCLQRLLDPRVAQPDPVFLDELLMKVAHVQIEVPVPVQAQNLFRLHFGTRLLLGFRRRRSSRPSVPSTS